MAPFPNVCKHTNLVYDGNIAAMGADPLESYLVLSVYIALSGLNE